MDSIPESQQPQLASTSAAQPQPPPKTREDDGRPPPPSSSSSSGQLGQTGSHDAADATLGPGAGAASSAARGMFDDVLDLEGAFYRQGRLVGEQDGARQGLVEGRVFGAERGFDRFAAVARLHGHAVVLGNRLLLPPPPPPPPQAGSRSPAEPGAPAEEQQQQQQRNSNGGGGKGAADDRDVGDEDDGIDGLIASLDFSAPAPAPAPAPAAGGPNNSNGGGGVVVRPLTGTARLERHVRTLYALTEPASLSLQNAEDDVSEFDDRLRRAQAKATILSRMVGYELAAADKGKGKGGAKGEAADDAAGHVRAQNADANVEDSSILQARH